MSRPNNMSEPKQTKKRSPLRRFLKAVFWTAGILVFLSVFAFFAALFLKERLTWLSVAGGILILCGVAVANRRREEGK